MTKLAELTPLFEMTAAELRQLRSASCSALERSRSSAGNRRRRMSQLADARTKDYDRAAQRHQLWLARYLESAAAGAT